MAALSLHSHTCSRTRTQIPTTIRKHTDTPLHSDPFHWCHWCWWVRAAAYSMTRWKCHKKGHEDIPATGRQRVWAGQGQTRLCWLSGARRRRSSRVGGLGDDSILNEMKTRCFHFGLPRPTRECLTRVTFPAHRPLRAPLAASFGLDCQSKQK